MFIIISDVSCDTIYQRHCTKSAKHIQS